MLDKILVKCHEVEAVSREDWQGMSVLSIEISKMLERKARIEKGYISKDEVLEAIARWQQKLVLIVNTVITEQKVLQVINNGGDVQEIKNELGKKILELSI
ncbi:MAG: hypothetical protein KKD44_27170 [Proteobacteria bacterium]|nr:hypothetical protein [Pseudomonadota bacterium]